jgi:hypothetical protein
MIGDLAVVVAGLHSAAAFSPRAKHLYLIAVAAVLLIGGALGFIVQIGEP